MQMYNFTEKARLVFAQAREEAVGLRHEYVGTEHLLLGLLRTPASLGSELLEQLNVERDTAAKRLLQVLRAGNAPPKVTARDLPYTSRSKKVLELAMVEANSLSHTWVGTEHLVLGILAEEKGIAAQVLLSFGATVEGARAQLRQMLSGGKPDEWTGTPSAGEHPTSIGLVLRYPSGAVVTKSFTNAGDAASFLAGL